MIRSLIPFYPEACMRRVFAGAFLLLFVLTAAPSFAQDGSALYAERCASCHDNGAASRSPSREAIAGLSADRIVETLETGVMRIQGESMTPQQRRAVATFLSRAANGGAAAGGAPGAASAAPAGGPATAAGAAANAPATNAAAANAPQGRACSGGNTSFAAAPDRNWASWGVTLDNARLQKSPGLTAAQVRNLTLKWAFGFEGETTAATQPTIAGDRVFVGSNGGRVYSLGLADGCVQWTFKADGGIRAAIAVAASRDATKLFFGDLRATVYALDAATGAQLWKQRVDEHRAARISGSPVFYNGTVYVPVSSSEEATGAMPTYECCTFRGSVVALDAASGRVLWKTYMIPDAPKPTGKNKAGTQLYGPSGVAVWSAPTIDTRTNVLYVATGDSYTQPASDRSDAVVAIDLKTGAVKWSRQLLQGDAWNMACGTPNPANCPENEGPDFDFGQSPILSTLPSGRRFLNHGQK
jgi:polyvinyl alcohol dehydrogenase (cytochrome)